MNNIRIYTFILLFLSIGQKINAQTVLLDYQNKPMYQAKVKFVDEFFARFNGKEIRKDVEEKYSDRESNILLLFNLAQFNSKSDSLFIEAKKFAHTVVQDSAFINYEDSTWYAKVECRGTLANKRVDFILYLLVEERGDYMYKWVIAGVEGKIFDTSRTRSHKELFMLPNAHEQSFLSLTRVTSDSGRYIDDFVKTNYEADALSVFLTLVRSGLLRIDYVTDVEFTFFQIPNYIFTIKHFEREKMNAGWLINSIEKCSEEDKYRILGSLHHITNRDMEVAKVNDTAFVDSVLREQTEIERIETEIIMGDILSSNEMKVRRFCDILRLWMDTGDVDYQKKAMRECAGKKGKDCLVNDRIMSEIAKKKGLQPDSLYKLKDYFTGLKSLVTTGNTCINFANIKQIGEEDNNVIISCDVKLLGEIEFNSVDVFIIRKKDNKIHHITSLDNYKRTFTN